jgi:GNAT superfamily N-acetyltransferase
VDFEQQWPPLASPERRSMADDYAVAVQHGKDIDSWMPELSAVYQEVYAEPPYNSGPLFDPRRFDERTRRQAERDGFTLVTARRTDHELIGYSFGLRFAEGIWWSGDATPPPSHILSQPKFAVIELVVRRPFRGRGLGRRLLDTLLAGRTEPFAVLTSYADAPARDLYRRWGWTQIGSAQHTADSPALDSLALALDSVG